MNNPDATTDLINALNGLKDQIVTAINAIVVDIPNATETTPGKAEIATQSETNAGTNDGAIITPLKFKNSFNTDFPVIMKLAGAKSIAFHRSGHSFFMVPSATVNDIDWDWTKQLIFDGDFGNFSVFKSLLLNQFVGSGNQPIYVDNAGTIQKGLTFGYAISIQNEVFNPQDTQVYSLASFRTTPAPGTTFATVGRIPVPKTGKLKNFISMWYGAGVAGTGENISIAIRLNNATDYGGVTVGNTNAAKTFTSGAIDQAVTAGDYIEIKLTCPTWATNPASVNITTIIYFE